MANSHDNLISVIVPVYNESAGLKAFHASLTNVLQSATDGSYEIIYCDDGSTDDSSKLIHQWHKTNPKIKLVKFSRNFGKENALSAGIASANGAAIITLDGDGQHPVELIPKFIELWKAGAEVVIGVRSHSKSDGLFKRLGSRFFYKLFNKLTGQELLAGSTDFRLIDESVQKAFLTLKETDRITRGLIDWLGFKREFIKFQANERESGSAAYGPRKLMRLAVHSFVSLTPTPLYLFGYLGIFITMAALILGASVFVEQLILSDPLGWRFTGTAMLGILIVFLVGIVLMSQGMLSLYISHMHSQIKRRPLYVIDYKASIGIKTDDA